MIKNNFDLKPFNTFGIAAKCKEFAEFHSKDEIDEILQLKTSDELFILGGGSNILFTKDFNGLILHNNIQGVKMIEESVEYVIIEAGAGMNWHQFVLYTIDKDYGGLENLSLIPGKVGASPMQNIGAYGVELKDTFHYLNAYHIKSGEVHRFINNDCEFGYRESVFKNKLKNQYIILNVAFKLSKQHKKNTEYGVIEKQLSAMKIASPTIRDISNAIIAIRTSKLPNPKDIGNAGSFFKNPVIEIKIANKLKERFSEIPLYPCNDGFVKIAAGWLIEKAGWKGYMEKSYGVHKNQALVLVNYGGSTGKEIFQLSQRILEDVNNKFGVLLEREVNIY